MGIVDNDAFFHGDQRMELFHFYFINDEYFEKFDDPYLMGNHKSSESFQHNRPYYFSIVDNETGLFWMIPVSSKVAKYEAIYNHKMKRIGKCETIMFANVLGRRKAFLLQNMCPITEQYVAKPYFDKQHKPVQLDRKTAIELIKKARYVLALHKHGRSLIFPDVRFIESKLLNCNDMGEADSVVVK